jgi:hypothetical protein
VLPSPAENAYATRTSCLLVCNAHPDNRLFGLLSVKPSCHCIGADNQRAGGEQWPNQQRETGRSTSLRALRAVLICIARIQCALVLSQFQVSKPASCDWALGRRTSRHKHSYTYRLLMKRVQQTDGMQIAGPRQRMRIQRCRSL